MLGGRSLHGVLDNKAQCGDGVCSEYTTMKMVVLKYYIAVNTEPSEINYLMSVCKNIFL